MKMTLTTWIDAPVEQVFTQGIDVANHTRRIPGITKIEMLTPGPVAVGTRFKETRRMFGKDATEVFTVTALEPNHSYTLFTNSCGVAYEATHTFTAENGGTRLTLTMTGRSTTFLAWMMAPLGWMMQGMMKKLIQKDIEDLKAYCEAETLPAG